LEKRYEFAQQINLFSRGAVTGLPDIFGHGGRLGEMGCAGGVFFDAVFERGVNFGGARGRRFGVRAAVRHFKHLFHLDFF